MRMEVGSHAFSQSQLSWLLNRLALVSGQQFAQLWINALLLSICSASQHSSMNAMHSKHDWSYIAVVQRWEPALGNRLILNNALVMQIPDAVY